MRSHLFALFSCLTLAASANAQVLKSNLGPGDSFQETATFGLAGINNGGNMLFRGVTFVPATTSGLLSVDLAVLHLVGANAYLIALAPDSGGQPGAPLETWTTSFPLAPSLVNLTSVLNPVLNTVTTYWLTVQAQGSDTGGGWHFNDQGELGLFSQEQVGGLWQSLPTFETPAYRINGGGGAAAPEPGTVALLGLGLAAAALARRRRA